MSNNGSGISVVVPAWNAARSIELTLGSLASASAGSAIEVLLVDDGSTDDTVAIGTAALQRSALPFQVLQLAHRGVSAARNAGWRRAAHGWILFLDADDVVAPSLFSVLRTAIAENPHAQVVHAPWQRAHIRHGDLHPVGEIVRPATGAAPPLDLIRTQNFIKTGSYAVRKGALDSVGGFDEGMHQIEDVNVLVRLAIAGAAFAAAREPDPQLFYRLRDPDAPATGNHDAFIEGCVRNAQLAEGWLRAQGALQPAAIAALSEVYFQATRHYAGRDWSRFREIFRQIAALGGKAIPRGPAALTMLSALVGYERAERIAVSYRALKRRAAQ